MMGVRKCSFYSQYIWLRHDLSPPFPPVPSQLCPCHSAQVPFCKTPFHPYILLTSSELVAGSLHGIRGTKGCQWEHWLLGTPGLCTQSHLETAPFLFFLIILFFLWNHTQLCAGAAFFNQGKAQHLWYMDCLFLSHSVNSYKASLEYVQWLLGLELPWSLGKLVIPNSSCNSQWSDRD